MNLSKEKDDLCPPDSLGVTAAGAGIEHLYLQTGHPGYLLNKLPVEIFAYMHVCVTPVLAE